MLYSCDLNTIMLVLYRQDLRQHSHATCWALVSVSQATASGGHGTQATSIGDMTHGMGRNFLM